MLSHTLSRPLQGAAPSSLPAEPAFLRAEPEKISAARAAAQGGADPVMLRAYAGGHKGATAFFRNRPLLDAAVDFLSQAGATRVLFHACSVGAEPFSFALWCHHRAPQWRNVQIFATDIEPAFLEKAQKAEFPASVLSGMTPTEQGWFEPRGENVVVPECARKKVSFLSPISFVDGEPGEMFDAVFVMNALTYVTPADQHRAIRKIAGYTRHLLGLTAFHPDTIATDVTASGFHPLRCDHRKIHDAWGDRLSPVPIAPGTPAYSWRLPPYDPAVPDHAYRFSSLFARKQTATAR